MHGTRHVEWLNQNAGRAYPFREDCALIPTGASGRMDELYRVPDGLVLDFVVSVPYGSPAENGVWMSSMTFVGGLVSLTFSDAGGSVIGSTTASSDAGANQRVSFSGSGDYEAAVGAVVFGDVAKIVGSYPDGAYSFAPNDSMVETRCVLPSVAGVTSFSATDENDVYSTRRLFGDVSLIAGRNITLRYDEGRNAIWIDAANDTGYTEECDCGDEDGVEVRTVNGISARNVSIVGGDCVSVTTANGVVTIEDTCSKPCCGCEELSFLSGKSNQIATALMKLSAFSEQLSARISTLAATIEINKGAIAAATKSPVMR